MNSISVENLSKEYKHFKLDNLNLSIPNGSVVGLVGANGAGKTTLIKLILGIIKKDSGTINIIDKEEIGIVLGEVLDIFREFMENDEHSILISSHITSDLENIADYIVLIDNGKIILNKSIMDITDNYGIIHCTKEIFEKLKNKAMNYRKNKYDYEVLIDNKKEIKREYKDLNIDKANIDEMMYLLLRGEKE